MCCGGSPEALLPLCSSSLAPEPSSSFSPPQVDVQGWDPHILQPLSDQNREEQKLSPLMPSLRGNKRLSCDCTEEEQEQQEQDMDGLGGWGGPFRLPPPPG